MTFEDCVTFLICFAFGWLLTSLATKYLKNKHRHDYELDRIINLKTKSNISYAMVYVHICNDPSCAKVKKTFVEF